MPQPPVATRRPAPRCRRRRRRDVRSRRGARPPFVAVAWTGHYFVTVDGAPFIPIGFNGHHNLFDPDSYPRDAIERTSPRSATTP
ncbi:MAG: hypothetical protein D6689_03210 [Deltaproteobacteria bacterium]|nr:MAG: hypothetical protein D6689_03210 [Deltaproteobacteria bacterium]